MSKRLFRKMLMVLSISFLLGIASISVCGQGQPWHPPAPGHIPQFIPMFPVGMEPVGQLPYSWEVGKNRTQRFGEIPVTTRRAREVKRLLKIAQRQQKAAKGPVTTTHP